MPEGKEGEPTSDLLVISGYVTNGLSRLTEYLSIIVIPEAIAAEPK